MMFYNILIGDIVRFMLIYVIFLIGFAQGEDNSKIKHTSLWYFFCYPIHRLSVVGLRPSSSISTGCVVPLRGDWAIFCHGGSGRLAECDQSGGKSLERLRRGRELNLSHREKSEIHLFSHWAQVTDYGTTTPTFYNVAQCWLVLFTAFYFLFKDVNHNITDPLNQVSNFLTLGATIMDLIHITFGQFTVRWQLRIWVTIKQLFHPEVFGRALMVIGGLSSQKHKTNLESNLMTFK